MINLLEQSELFMGGIMVYSYPDGAEIYIDGTPAIYPLGEIIRTPVFINNISIGTHHITFRLPGYIDKIKTIDVRYNEWVDIDAILQPDPSTLQPTYLHHLQPAPGWPALPIPQIPYGHIVATTIPDRADIYLDGQPVLDWTGNIATTPITILYVATGTRRITFKKQGYFDEDIYVFVQNGLYSDAYTMLRSKMETMSTLSELGDLFIDSNPQGAYVYIDGNVLIDINGRTILTPVRVTAVREGLHDVQVSLDGYYSKKVLINVIPDHVNNMSVTLQQIYG